MAVNRKPLAQLLQEVQTGEDITNRAIRGEGFDPRGGWGVAAAQIATAGIGAWAQNRARKEIAEKEVANQQQFAESYPEYANMASQLSPETRQAYTAARMTQDLKAANPEPLTGIAKLGADYKAGLIDESTYKSAARKETTFAPDASSTGGATGAIIANLRKENSDLTYAQALSQAQGLARQGLGFDPSGNVVEMSGLSKAKSDIKYAEAKGAATGTATGKDRGEAINSLNSQESKLPELELTVQKLSDLGKVATYTKAGQARDATLRELGLSMTDAGIARREYTSMVDNQILPLLRDTFGAQFTEREGETLKKTLGDVDASPAEKDAVLKSFIKQKKASVESTKRQIGGSNQALIPNRQQNLKSKYGLK
jgi:hypothetical protein